MNTLIDLVIGIAANKSDLFENEAVSESLGRGLAKEMNAEFGQVSARTGDGIENLFYSLLERCHSTKSYLKCNDYYERNEGLSDSTSLVLSKDPKGEKEENPGCCS